MDENARRSASDGPVLGGMRGSFRETDGFDVFDDLLALLSDGVRHLFLDGIEPEPGGLVPGASDAPP